MSILLKNVILEGRQKDIFIEGERIKRIGENLGVRAGEEIDGYGQKAVLPGFVNGHSHSAMILFRGFSDDLPLKEWLEKKIFPLEAGLTEDDVYWGTKMALLEMIKSGTTAINEMYWYPEAQVEAVREMGIRAVIGLVMADFSPLGSREKVEKSYKGIRKNLPDFISLSVAPHAIYSLSRENLIWASDFARKNKLLLHIHLSETEKEVEDCLRERKMRPAEYLEEIGFLGENSILAHSIWLSDKEIDILRKRAASLVYNPSSNMKLASGVFPFERARSAGLNISLGTDGPASNNSLDMFEEMKFASLLQKINGLDPTLAKAEDIFKTATVNGDRAIRADAGRLVVGQLADLMLIDLDNVSLLPGHNLISDLVYSANGSCVSDLISNGKIIMRERRVEGEEEIKREAKKRADKKRNS